MKQSDIFTIVVVASVGMLAAFLVGNAIFGDPNLEKVEFKKVRDISSEIMEPDPELFNREAINPTVEVEVGVCEDTNGNGILDQDERDKCLGVDGGDSDSGTVDDETDTTTDTEEVVDNGTTD